MIFEIIEDSVLRKGENNFALMDIRAILSTQRSRLRNKVFLFFHYLHVPTLLEWDLGG
jgi:hypothetical protein